MKRKKKAEEVVITYEEACRGFLEQMHKLISELDREGLERLIPHMLKLIMIERGSRELFDPEYWRKHDAQ